MLTFDEAAHIYRWAGAIVPSVTQVLEDVGIVDYSRIPGETRERALARGSRVHAATAMEDVSGVPLDPFYLLEEDAGYVEAWRRFRAEKRFRTELVEQQVYNPLRRYAGTLDRTGYFEAAPAVRYVVDLKTGAAEWWVRVQLAAYCATFPDPRTLTRLCVELHADGTYRLYPFDGRTWQADMTTFLYALAIYNAKRERRIAA
jgi:hypothetical protein